MLTRLAALCAVLASAACAPQQTLLQRPPDGYQALRFRETVRLNAGLGTHEFVAGTVLVQDRTRADGLPLWCRAGGDGPACVSYDGRQIGIAADVLPNGYQRDLPPDSTEITRLR